MKEVSIKALHFEVLGDTAWEMGENKITLNPPGGQDYVSMIGKHLVIWKRQIDGSWKIHVDIWNSSIPK